MKRLWHWHRDGMLYNVEVAETCLLACRANFLYSESGVPGHD